MDFYEVLEQVIILLERHGRMSYRALKRQFAIGDDFLADLIDELVEIQQIATNQDDRMLVLADKREAAPVPSASPTVEPTSRPDPTTQPDTPAESPPVEPTRAESQIDDAERRQLTVMFCDLVGSTDLSGQLDPEDLREVVQAYQAACTGVIQRYEGYVAQHLGDGLLVYFGYPAAHEDDAQRAVRTGIDIIGGMQVLNERLEQGKGVRLRVRIAVHTGPVVIGGIGSGERQEQLALGEVPNVAARIQGVAEPDTVVISEATSRLIYGYFECDSLGEHALKGVSEPVPIYRVIRESEAQHQLDITASRGLTPLIGRESELSLLMDRWEQAKSGLGQVVLLSGEAGIGKSKLTRTLRERVANETHNRLECRCSPYFQNTTLYPLIDLLERTLGFERQDTPEIKFQKLETALSQYRLDIDTTVPLLAYPLSLPLPEDRYPPLNMTPQRRKQKALETFISLLLETAEREPVLFILEDLHWVDATTIELLDLLIEHVPTASLLLVLTCRPEFQPAWGLKSHLTPIALNRLPRDQIERLVERVADGKRLPDEVIQHLIQKTDGVPLYVEEMTKALLESDHLQETDTGYALTEALDTLSVPTTLQDSLMARLDRLDSAKGVAQLGATIGRQFSYDLLQAVSSLSEPSLQRELDKLIDAELIYQRGLAPHSSYTFKHALVQDIAYESLLRRTRQEYHQRIADVLEAQFAETTQAQPELLAHHLTEAGRYELASNYWYQAALRAQDRSAHREAIHHLTQALDGLARIPHSPEQILRELDLQLALANSLGSVHGWASPTVETAYVRARELSEQVGDDSRRYLVLHQQHSFYLVRADFETAQDLAAQRLQIAQNVQNPLFLLQAHMQQGHIDLHLGAFIQARQHFELGIEAYCAHQSPPPMTLTGGQDSRMFARSWLAITLWLLGYPAQSTQQSQEALAITHEFEVPSNLLSAFGYANWLFAFQRNPVTAQEWSQKSWALASEHGFAQHLAHGMIRRGLEQIEQGDQESGSDLVNRGVEDYRKTGALARVPMFLGQLASAYHAVGKPEEGLTTLAEAMDVSKQTGERWWDAELQRLRGEFLLQLSGGNPFEAESCFHQAISMAQNQSAKTWELRAATSLARLWQSQGKRDKAREVLGDVYGWFTEGFDTADLLDAKALLTELEEGIS